MTSIHKNKSMNHSSEELDDMTLDPPGRIAVIGGGPLGVEAALYGRFLGYEVQLFEKGEIGQSLLATQDQPLPMMPDRCLSPLAVAALKAQDGGLIFPGDPTYPITVRQWINGGLIRLTSTDLLRGQVFTGCKIVRIELAPEVQDDAQPTESETDADDDFYVDGEVPPDYRLTMQDESGIRAVDFEAVILAIGPGSTDSGSDDSISGYEELVGGPYLSRPYLFRIGQKIEGNDEARLHRGLREIVSIYANLGGRSTLDLYRPIRSE